MEGETRPGPLLHLYSSRSRLYCFLGRSFRQILCACPFGVPVADIYRHSPHLWQIAHVFFFVFPRVAGLLCALFPFPGIIPTDRQGKQLHQDLLAGLYRGA